MWEEERGVILCWLAAGRATQRSSSFAVAPGVVRRRMWEGKRCTGPALQRQLVTCD